MALPKKVGEMHRCTYNDIVRLHVKTVEVNLPVRIAVLPVRSAPLRACNAVVRDPSTGAILILKDCV